MQPARRLVLTDVASAAGLIVVPGIQLVYSGRAEWWHVLATLFVAVPWFWFLYVYDRDAFPPFLLALEDRPFVLVAVGAAFGLCSLVALLLWPSVVPIYLAGFVGMGVAHLGNRLVFGVIRPPPADALERTHQE